MPKSKASFKQQVMTVMGGTAVAQAISLLMMPLLTRIFTPQDFGIFAIFSAVVAIWSLLATFRLENAILMPKSEAEARELLALGVWCGILSCSVLYFALKLFSLAFALQFLTFCEIIRDHALLIALNCFLLGFCNLMGQWHNRHARFEVSARRVIFERLSFMLLALALVKHGSTGLILAQILSVAIVFLYLLFAARNALSVKSFAIHIGHWHLLKSYSQFSLKHGAGTLVQMAAWQLPPILISVWFPVELVGKYNLATRILEAPLNLIGNSFSGVFYRKLSVSEPQRWREFISRTLRPLILVPPIPIFIFCAFAPQIFAFAFGPNWYDSGRFFSALSFLYWWRLIYIACSPSYLVLNRLGTDLFFSALLLASQLGSVYLGYLIFNDLHTMLILTSTFTSSVIIASVIWVYREISKRSYTT